MTDMTGKTVLITGASKGIGAAAARVFAQAGAKLVLMARSADALASLAQETDGIAVAGDVSNWESVQGAVARAVEETGRLDVLINNAGLIEPIGMMDTIDPHDFAHVIDVNLKGVYYGVRAALPVMKAQGGGYILTVSSGAAHNALEGWAHYCTSKAGVAMLTRCIHREMSGAGIRAMDLSPGTVATDMQIAIKASGINAVAQLDPSAHIPVDWPAKALLWMCGPDAEEFTGTEISLRDEGIRKRVGLI